MSDDIRIWEIDLSSKAATPVEADNQVVTEKTLEDVLVGSSDMLMPDLTLVGRQTNADGGYLDLLGVDADGRLVVFELKKGKLTREAVAQVIEYCSYLDSLTDAELANYIVTHSGRDGGEKIDDLEEWYVNRHGEELTALRPTKMVLVGLGADTRARRMVEFLAGKGMDITLLTFNGYRDGKDRTLLARQVEKGSGSRSPRPFPDPHNDLWRDVAKALSIAFKSNVRKTGITFSLPKIPLPDNVNAAASHSVAIDPSGRIKVTFYPAAIDVYLGQPDTCLKQPDVCLDQFKKKNKTLPFEFEVPPNAPTTPCVQKQGYCLLDEESWNTRKDALIKLASDVHEAWHEVLRNRVKE